MIKSVFIRSIFCLCLLVFICMNTTQQQAIADDTIALKLSSGLITKIKPLAKLISKDKPLLQEASQILGSEKNVIQSNDIIIDKLNYKIRIMLISDHSCCVEEISFHFSNKFGLRMKHITSALGQIKPQQYHPAKTYSSRYGYYNSHTNVLSYIIISTLTMPTDPEAPVTSITIRRDENPPPEILKSIAPLIFE